MNLHLQGMWFAFAVAAFVHRVLRHARHPRPRAAAPRGRPRAQARALRSEKLASLATLAAGAAHELATPLATIAVVAKELERELRQRQQRRRRAPDPRRGRPLQRILEQMATDAGESAGEAFRQVDVRDADRRPAWTG